MSNAIRAGVFVLALVTQVSFARADMLFFKDGFAVQGRVKRQMTIEFDQIGGEAYHMPKGFFFVDDGARRIFFPPSQVSLVYPKDPPIEEKVVCPDTRPQVNPRKMPDMLAILKEPEWDAKWNRRYKFRAPSPYGVVDVPQHITWLTPHWARVDSPGNFSWACAYLTREFGPERVRALLNSHPDFQEKNGMAATLRVSRRLRKADFYGQAGWYDLADHELDRILLDTPDQKPRVEAARKTLVRLRARDRLEEIKRRHLGGQHETVRKMIAEFKTKGVPERMLTELQELKAEYENTDRLLKETTRLLDQARHQVAGAHRLLLAEAAAIIRSNLNFENVARLDAFLGQARQRERFLNKGKPSPTSAEQLLSLAVSGWLMGSASAEASAETAVRLWHGQELIRTYLRTENEEDRRALVKAHLKKSKTEAASLDELVQIIHQLPPIDPEAKPSDRVMERKVDDLTYLVKLPPEYRHSRPFPLLVVLHQSGEAARDMLDRWTEAAAEHGFILVAPTWQPSVAGRYGYSEGEHAVVLNALKDVKRHFNVDDDRVFLFGNGEGGAMAFDVGLGHPDLFAGVMPMSAAPRFHASICWRNGQYLPFYVVNGNRGPNGQDTRNQFESWVQRNFPMLWVDYKGRGVDWFGGEVPHMFDWMRGKRRAFPLHRLGTDGNGTSFGNEFCTERACDNHFYWLSADVINPGNINRVQTWRGKQPASLHARIDRHEKDNFIWVSTSGIKQVTIWLGRNSKGEDMIDFDKPVRITANRQVILLKNKNFMVKPSVEVLLEDLYQRGDRQMLFLAKIPLIF